MRSISHREVYLRLLSDDYVDALIRILREDEFVATLGVLEIERRFYPDVLPYLHIRVDTEAVFSARLTGLFLGRDLMQQLAPAFRRDHFYLPTICVCDTYAPPIAQLIDAEASLKHELIHLQDMLQIVEKDPSFVERMRIYGIGNIRSPKHLARSIDLEVYKIFTLEPPAFRSDFRHGERSYHQQFMGRIISYQCQSEEEYVRCQVASYISTLESSYEEKFEKERETIRLLMRAAVNRHGRTLFGADAHETCRAEHESTMQKLVQEILG